MKFTLNEICLLFVIGGLLVIFSVLGPVWFTFLCAIIGFFIWGLALGSEMKREG